MSRWSDPYRWLSLRNDVRAVRRRRVGKRIARRLLGRFFGRLMRVLVP